LPKLNITLRVNGQVVGEVQSRFAIENGFPGGSPELVIQDPLVGEIVLNDTCMLEVDEGEGFRKVTTHALLVMLRTRAEGL
jgi:hypothetical protein